MRTVIGAVVVSALLIAAPAALAHQGNPHFRSTIKRVTPATSGVHVSVLNYDDRLLLENFSGRTVVVEDYKGKPYVRILGDRTVQVNTNSEAYYLNDDRYGNVTVPKGLGSQPNWKTQSRTGRFDWHDHRIHWMSTSTPPQVKNVSRRVHIFDWKVPITIGGRRGAIAGSLTWVPIGGGSAPIGLIAGVSGVIIALLLVLTVRRHRRLIAEDTERTPEEAAEAW